MTTSTTPPLAGAPDLHAAIMNLLCDPDQCASKDWVIAFKEGHKIARHAAADIAVSTRSQHQSMPESWRETLGAIAKWMGESAQIVQNGPDDFGPASQFDHELGQAAAEIQALLAAPAPQSVSAPLEQEVPEHILGAVARGWCSPLNENKVMDVDLAVAIAREVAALRPAVAPQSVSVPEGWHDLIKWLLGENGTFPNRKSTNDGLYWWRKDLRARYNELLTAAPAAPLPQPQADAPDAVSVLRSIIHDGYLSDSNTGLGHAVLDAIDARYAAALSQQGEGSIDSDLKASGLADESALRQWMAERGYGNANPLAVMQDLSARLARTAAPNEIEPPLSSTEDCLERVARLLERQGRFVLSCGVRGALQSIKVSAASVTLRNWLALIHDNERSIGDRLQSISSTISTVLNGDTPPLFDIREQTHVSSESDVVDAAHRLLDRYCVANLKDGQPAHLLARIAELHSWYNDIVQSPSDIPAGYFESLRPSTAPSKPMTFDQFFDEAARKGLTIHDLVPGVKAKLAEMERAGEIVKHADGGHTWTSASRECRWNGGRCGCTRAMAQRCEMVASQPPRTGVAPAIPRVLGVTRDSDSPGDRGVIAFFERRLTDDELRTFHDSLAGRVQAPQAIPTDLSKRLRDGAYISRADIIAAADEIDRYYGASVALREALRVYLSDYDIDAVLAKKGGAA